MGHRLCLLQDQIDQNGVGPQLFISRHAWQATLFSPSPLNQVSLCKCRLVPPGWVEIGVSRLAIPYEEAGRKDNKKKANQPCANVAPVGLCFYRPIHFSSSVRRMGYAIRTERRTSSSPTSPPYLPIVLAMGAMYYIYTISVRNEKRENWLHVVVRTQVWHMPKKEKPMPIKSDPVPARPSGRRFGSCHAVRS